MTRDQMLARFEAEHMAPNSITALRRIEQLRVLNRFAATLGGRTLVEMTGDDVRAFMGAEIERGLSPNTVRKYHGMIRAFCTWAAGAELIEPDRREQLRLVRNPRGSTARSTPKPYKPDEIARLKAVLSERYPPLPTSGKGSHALSRFTGGHVTVLRGPLWRFAVRLQLEAQIALALELGLRSIEILHLTIPGAHYDNDQLVVLTAKQGPGRQVNRAVPYTAHARQCMQEWLDFRLLLVPAHQSPWLYLRRGGSRQQQLAELPEWKMHDMLRKGLGPEWEWHRLRHTAATEWLRAGARLEKVQIAMGHSTLEQTRMYTKIAASDVTADFGAAEASFAKRLGIAA